MTFERVAPNAGPTPVLLKIAPDLSLAELDDVVGIARSRRVDGMIVGNTTLSRPPNLRATKLAREAGVHPGHLSHTFRRCIGEGIGEHVHRLRVRAACKRMLDPYASLAEVSFAAGFADQSHFTRSFRRITGMTPAAFRSVLLRST